MNGEEYKLVVNAGDIDSSELSDDDRGAIIHLGKTLWGIMQQLEEMNRAGAGNVPQMAATGVITLEDSAGDIAGAWTITVDRTH